MFDLHWQTLFIIFLSNKGLFHRVGVFIYFFTFLCFPFLVYHCKIKDFHLLSVSAVVVLSHGVRVSKLAKYGQFVHPLTEPQTGWIWVEPMF